MDRFIAVRQLQLKILLNNLKSNMDRFIVLACFVGLGLVSAFKIQYG